MFASSKCAPTPPPCWIGPAPLWIFFRAYLFNPYAENEFSYSEEIPYQTNGVFMTAIALTSRC